MYSSLKRRSKMARRVYDQVLFPGGTLTIFLDYRYDHLKQTPTTYMPQCTSHQWGGVEEQALFFFTTGNVNLCLYRYINFHQNVNIVQTKKTLYNQCSH